MTEKDPFIVIREIRKIILRSKTEDDAETDNSN